MDLKDYILMIWIVFKICRWVREFLSDENRGLDVLVDYLNFRLMMMRQEHRIKTANSEESVLNYNNNVVQNCNKFQGHHSQQQQQQNLYHNHQQQQLPLQIQYQQQQPSSNGTMSKAAISDFSNNSDSPTARRRSKHVAKLNMGEAQDDIHLCILCLRAIMNNKVNLHNYTFYFGVFIKKFQFKRKYINRGRKMNLELKFLKICFRLKV